jgi:hypothetical protein
MNAPPVPEECFDVQTYRELEIDGSVEIDRDLVTLRDVETGALFAVDRRAFTTEAASGIRPAVPAEDAPRKQSAA